MSIRFVTEQEDTKDKVHAFLEEWNSSMDTIEVKTSGSTGVPKTIRIKKEQMIASAKATGDFLQLKKGDSALLSLSIDTVGGKMMIVRSLVLELELLIGDVSSNPLKGIEEVIHFGAMVPMQLQKTLELNPIPLSKVEKLIIGGAPVSDSLIEQIQTVPTNIYQTFGMTETISHIALRRLNHPFQSDYQCLPSIHVSEENHTLIIDAPALGVHQLKTNDEVILSSPTSFQWLGRTDFVINSGGVKIHPEIIESTLTQLIPYPFFIYGEKDELLGEKVVLIVEHSRDLGLTKSDFAAILNSYSIPKSIRYVASFAYTESGKINRLISKDTVDVAFKVL